jgi:hypothetical protein
MTYLIVHMLRHTKTLHSTLNSTFLLWLKGKERGKGKPV